jgi:hypothetical protein
VDAVSRQTTQIPLLDSPWWKAEIEGKLPYAERTRLKALIDNSILLADGRARAIDGMVAKRGEYEAKQQAHNQQVTEQTNGIMFNRLEEMRKGMDWAQPITPKGTETPEELATIEAHNNDFKVHEERFNKALNPPDPLTRVETAAAAVLAFKLQDVLEKSVEEFNGKEAAYKNEIANLQKQLGKFVKAGSTSRAAAAAPVNGKPANQANRYQMKDEDAFEALAQEVGI